MKKISCLLFTTFLVGCGQSLVPQSYQQPQRFQRFSAQELTARTGFTQALKEAQKVMKQPELYEIDVYKDAQEDSLSYGFIAETQPGIFTYVIARFDRQSQQLKSVHVDSSKAPPDPVYQEQWQLDNPQVLNIARENGLQDPQYLATLWEDTWHISGLAQHLYFQLNSENGHIKLVCLGPFMDKCYTPDEQKVKPERSQEKERFKAFLNKRLGK